MECIAPEIFLSKKGTNFFCPKKERGRRPKNFWGQICEESEASKQASKQASKRKRESARGILSQGPHKRAHYM